MFKCFLYISVLNLLFIVNGFSNELRIYSNNLVVNRTDKISTFSGNVYAYNQKIQIWSEKLVLRFNENKNEIDQVNAETNVKIMREGITATGETGRYYPKSEVVNLYGNVEVIENDNFVKCDELFLDLKNSMSIMKSNTSNRVEAFISEN